MKINKLLIVLPLLAILAACHPADKPATYPATVADVHLIEQEEMEKGALDFSHIVVLRLTREDKRVEVTSLLPAVIAQADVSGQPVKTIFSLNKAGDTLILFSRDIRKDSSFKTEIKFDDLEKKRGFVFPVVQADGGLQEQSFKLEKIVKPQQ